MSLASPDCRADWEAYLAERRGTYDYRCNRYRAVWDECVTLGVADGDLVYDLGAGMCEFGRYIYSQRNWTGRYVPVDGAIDGTNLEAYRLPTEPHIAVAIEVVEHLHTWRSFLDQLQGYTTRGAVITTPNPEAVDVRGMDRTHVSPIERHQLLIRGWRVKTVSLFGTPDDTLIGIYEQP